MMPTWNHVKYWPGPRRAKPSLLLVPLILSSVILFWMLHFAVPHIGTHKFICKAAYTFNSDFSREFFEKHDVLPHYPH